MNYLDFTAVRRIQPYRHIQAGHPNNDVRGHQGSAVVRGRAGAVHYRLLCDQTHHYERQCVLADGTCDRRGKRLGMTQCKNKTVSTAAESHKMWECSKPSATAAFPVFFSFPVFLNPTKYLVA
jgi:hypothetical protein